MWAQFPNIQTNSSLPTLARINYLSTLWQLQRQPSFCSLAVFAFQVLSCHHLSHPSGKLCLWIDSLVHQSWHVSHVFSYLDHSPCLSLNSLQFIYCLLPGAVMPQLDCGIPGAISPAHNSMLSQSHNSRQN